MAGHLYQLTIDDVTGPLRIHAIRGKEALSQAWHFDVTVSCALGADVQHVALGQRATLLLDAAEKPRAFYGIVRAVTVEEVDPDNGIARHVVRVVPRLAMLKRKKRTRIFQRLSVLEIVTKVLADAGIASRWAIARSYPRREYCTQYEETDYDFVRRILAEAGFYFYFFDGGPVDSGLLAASAAIGAVAAGAGAPGVAIGPAAAAAAALPPPIPGDTVVCADDALFYPSVAGDDALALAASTVAAMSSTVIPIEGVDGIAGAATALVGSALRADATVIDYVENSLAASRIDKIIVRFAVRNEARAKSAIFRDYDPEKPLVPLESAAVSTAPFAPSPFDLAAAGLATMATGASASASIGGVSVSASAGVGGELTAAAAAVGEALGAPTSFDRYEHHSPFLFPKWSVAGSEAPLMLRQERRRASIASGESRCQHFSPGHRFQLAGHALDGEYVVTRVRHSGHDTSEGKLAYTNAFECAPASMTYPPRRPARSSVQVALTAAVVGPPGEEIHVDERGRIKVRFHWDRENSAEGDSSCWLRTMQTWAGPAWGHQFVPRVGMEVIVVFEGGDPDKPIVLGTVYNATHPPSFKLPDEKTKSGIRTQTTPGGNGFNELSFEDGAGREELFLRAQRDLTEEVTNDRHTKVGSNVHENVGGDKAMVVGKNMRQAVSGDHHSFVQGAHFDSVRGNRKTRVRGTYKLQVDSEMALEVGTADEPRSQEVFTHGNYLLGSAATVSLSASTAIRLQCGSSVLEVGPKEIRLVAESIVLDAQKELTAKGDGPGLKLADVAELTSKTIRLVSEKASIELAQNATIDGKQILINCQGIAPNVLGKPGSHAKKKLNVTFSDQDFEPIASKDFIAVAGGARFEGTTAGDGSIDLDVPAEAESATVTIFAEKRPLGRQLKYEIRLTEAPPPDTLPGVKARLQNLGYYWGEANDVLDQVTRNALREFQEDHGLPLSGAPDDATMAKLQGIAKL